MLDRLVVKEFLLEESEDVIDIPDDITLDDLVECFARYTENDLYEWLRDNYKSFFGHDWEWIRGRIEDIKGESN